jgi:hypothetical protein
MNCLKVYPTDENETEVKEMNRTKREKRKDERIDIHWLIYKQLSSFARGAESSKKSKISPGNAIFQKISSRTRGCMRKILHLCQKVSYRQ